MEQNDQQQPDAILNSSKLTLTLPPDRDGSRPRLCVGVYNGNVSLTCFTGLKTDEGKNEIIRAPMDVFAFQVLMNELRSLADGNTAGMFSMDCLSYPKDDGGRRDLVTVAKVILKRREDGFISISVHSPNPSMVQREFPFGIPDGRFFKPTHRNKENAAIEINHTCVRAYIDVMGHIVRDLAIKTYIKPAPKNGQARAGNYSRQDNRGSYNRGGGGGYNRGGSDNSRGGGGDRGGHRGGGDGGGHAKSNAPQGGYDDMNDDIPF